jgi:Kef-type K+ transport system membrane component KefB
MATFATFATPWWVNLALIVPFVAWWIFRKKKLALGREQLLFSLFFGIAFGFVEAAVVIYLRFALGAFTTSMPLHSNLVTTGTTTLFAVEIVREAATMIMLAMVALLTSKGTRERWAIFLWSFAAWDAFYYLFLLLVIHWPPSFLTTDLLFLIPTPWYAGVWFPLLIDVLAFAAVLTNLRKNDKS